MARFRIRVLPVALLALAVVGAVVSVPLSLGREPLFDTVLYPVNAIGLALAGALIASYQRVNPLGWVLVGMGVDAAWVEFAGGYGVHPGWPAVATIEWIAYWANQLGIGATVLVLVLFPTGRGLGRVRQALVWTGAVSIGFMTVGAAFGHSSDPFFRSGRNPYAIDGLEPVSQTLGDTDISMGASDGDRRCRIVHDRPSLAPHQPNRNLQERQYEAPVGTTARGMSSSMEGSLRKRVSGLRGRGSSGDG